MARSGPDLRLFAAVYPEADAARAMLDLLASLSLPPHRVTQLEQVHLTVQFIGETHARDVRDVSESVERSASGLKAFDLRPMRLITIPERGPVRLLAVRTDEPPSLMELHRRLATRLARSRAGKPDAFAPHVTLCRFRDDARPEPMDAAVELPALQIDRVRLMSSRQTREGAVHQVVSETLLG